MNLSTDIFNALKIGEISIPVCRIQKFNMKCEMERMEIIYTFYFFLPF